MASPLCKYIDTKLPGAIDFNILHWRIAFRMKRLYLSKYNVFSITGLSGNTNRSTLHTKSIITFMFSCVLGYVILLHRRSFEFDFRLKKAAHSCITPFICIPKFFIEDCMGHQKHGRNPSSCQVSINAGLTVLANFIFLLVVDHTDGNRAYENHLFSSERPDIPASLFSGKGIWFQIPFVKVWKFFLTKNFYD